MRIDVKEVRIGDYLPAVADLARQNWGETGFDFDLDLDGGRIQALQDAGVAIALAAFDGDKVVGYSTAYISPHTFNPRIICCLTEALFVDPEYRKCSAAYKLIRETERVAAQRGANRVLWGTRAGTKLADTLMRRGCVPWDITVARRLEHGGP